MKKIQTIVPLIIGILFLSGCATTMGPKVTYSEVAQARDELRAKAIAHRFEQLQRVLNIGHKLIVNLPEEDRQKGSPFLGMYVVKINGDVQRAYSVAGEYGAVIVAIIENSPADRAGLKIGNIVLRIGNKKIRGVDSFISATSRESLQGKKNVEIEINRLGEKKIFLCEIDTVPRRILFDMVDHQEINAGATHNSVVVTYGLMKFAKSDDELAVVLGHELAHITKGHVQKVTGAEMITGAAAIGLGILSEYVAPGTGADVIRAASGIGKIFGRSYSRDLEREADYFGIKYAKCAGYDYEVASKVWERFAIEVPESIIRNYLHTHPSSSERMVRLKKIVEELKTEETSSQ